MALTKITKGAIADGAVDSSKIEDGSIVNADVSPSAAIASGKLTVDTSVIEADVEKNAFNISLLGFKMAVNDGLTVFNLVDGVVDEFHDESGTDEAEGSNDTYCATSDNYVNQTTTTTNYSAGFAIASVTEPDTSTAGTNPTYGAGTFGTFTVPSGMTSSTIQVWGAGGGGSNDSPANDGGGGGGYGKGDLAVTPGQALRVSAGEGGAYDSSPTPSNGTRALAGGGDSESPTGAAGGGGLSGVFTSDYPGLSSAPQAYIVAGSGGGGAFDQYGGAGGGNTGHAAGTNSAQQSQNSGGGGGGGQSGGGGSNAQGGSLFQGGNAGSNATGGGGAGFYGGGGGHKPGDHRAGGGGSGYDGHPQITNNTKLTGEYFGAAGTSQPGYVAGTSEGAPHSSEQHGEDGYVLITGSVSSSATASTTIVSNAFAASSAVTTSRIVVFEEDVDTPTLNTDIIASISRDGGSTFTTATLSDSGYVTGSSGQRILTGQATVSGQPSGQSMRWKLALANNAVKIHGVSLQWS